MIAAFVVLALVAFTNYALIFFSCHGLKDYGAWLNKYHKVDLWLVRVMVSQGELLVFHCIVGIGSVVSRLKLLCSIVLGSEWHRHLHDMDNNCHLDQPHHCYGL